MGYKRAGFEVIGCNEIDPKMMAVYIENHHSKYSYCEGIQTFKLRDDLPEELYNLDILDGSPPCFGAGTLVMTENKLQEIETIQIGQKVLTHKNRFCRVNAVYQKEATGYFVLKIQGMLPTNVTGEHPLYVRRMKRKGHISVRTFSQPEWKAVKDLSIVKNNSNSTLEQDYIGIAINQKSELPVWGGVIKRHVIHGRSERVKTVRDIDFSKPAFWYLIGRYMGDGWMRIKENRRNEFIICCAKNEIEEVKTAIENANFTYTIAEHRTTYRFTISSKELCAYALQFGKGAKEKHLTGDILNLPVDLLSSFLDGYIESDGHFDESRKKWSVSSISKNLIIGIQHCIHKVYKIATSIAIKDNPKYASTIEGRIVKTNMAYSLQFFKDTKKQQHSFYEDGYLWAPYRQKYEVIEKLVVYNIGVEHDESYTFNNAICHNCSSFSSAGNREKDWGKEKKFREGQSKQVLDTLFFDFIDLAAKLQPRIVIAENVKGLMQGAAYGYVKKIYAAFREAGYSVRMHLLDASKMGVPQRRERVFFTAMRIDLAKQMEWGNVNIPELDLRFNERPVVFGEFADYSGRKIPNGKTKLLWENRVYGDSGQDETNMRMFGKGSNYGQSYIYEDKVCCTLMSKDSSTICFNAPNYLSKQEVFSASTYPQDYDLQGQRVQYICGMSVPPVMTAQVATRINEQWLTKLH